MLKRGFVIVVVVLGVLALTTMSFAGSAPGSGIRGTAHDLSSTGKYGTITPDPNDSKLNRICVYCHAPHHTLKTTNTGSTFGVTYLPLWNHDITQQQNYTTYTNGSQDFPLPSFVQQGVGQPGSVSRLCLSCHDGSVAINQYGDFESASSVGSNNLNMSAVNAAGLVGKSGDLSNHHPIGFSYAAAAAIDNEIAPSSYPMVTTTTASGTTVFLKIQDVLYQGKMECATCHDVHNSRNQGDRFTWVQDTNSALCLTCHLKDSTAGQLSGNAPTFAPATTSPVATPSAGGVHGQ